VGLAQGGGASANPSAGRPCFRPRVDATSAAAWTEIGPATITRPPPVLTRRLAEVRSLASGTTKTTASLPAELVSKHGISRGTHLDRRSKYADAVSGAVCYTPARAG
jgi:hypothetical protein